MKPRVARSTRTIRQVFATGTWLCLTLALPAATLTWDGGHGSSNDWDKAPNWDPNSAPTTNDVIQFGGTAALTPNMQANYTVSSVTFLSGVGAFTLGSTTGKTLTIVSGGLTNNSTNLQTITNTIKLGASQTWTAATGNLLVTGNVDLNYNALTVAGAADTTITGNLGTSWSDLTKTGAGTLTLSGDNSSFNGKLVINQGTVVAASSTALGSTSTYNNTVANGGTLALQNGITVTKGDITIAGAGYGGAGAIRNTSGNNTLNATVNLSANATITSASGRLTLDKEVYVNGYVVTLAGSGDIVSNQQYTGSGGITVTDSGNRTFNGAINTAAGVTLSGTGTTTFNQNLNFSTSGTLTVNSGTINIGAAVNAVNFVQNGGTTTFTGSGNVTITNFTVNDGEVVFDKTSGHLRSDHITIGDGGTVSFLNDNQIFEWDDVTLNDGATLNLNNTVQTIDKLTINGNAIIDFGDAGSDFNINDLTLTADSVLTIVNWNDTVDSFFAQINPGSSSLAKVVFEGYGEATWDPYSGNSGFITPGSPVPEPSAYGALFLSGLLGLGLSRRPPRRPPAPSAA